MPGTSTLTGQESITFTDNMSFDGTERGGAFNSDGQIWLGSGTLPHVRKSNFVSSDGSLSFLYTDTSATDGQMDVTVLGGSSVGKTLKGNSGPQLSPILGNWNIYGATAPSGTNPIRTIGVGNTITVTSQLSQSIAATDATKVGLAAFDSADFSVDANGFVSLTGGSSSIDLTADTGGTATGASFTLAGSGSITTSRSSNTITTELTGLTNHAVLVGAGTSTITKLAVGQNGQVLIGSFNADPVFNDISPGTGISISGGPGTVQIDAIGGGLSWADITVPSVTLVANNGYISNRAGLVTYTLPLTCALGSMFAITNINTAVGWRVAQRAGQQIRLGNTLSTAGVGGYIEATTLGDSVVLVCTVTDTTFIAINWVGFLTIV